MHSNDNFPPSKEESLDSKKEQKTDSSSELPTHIVITQKLAESVKVWKAKGGLLKLTPGDDEALKAFLGSEKLAERAMLNWEEQKVFVEAFKADPANPEIYHDPQHILYAASALKSRMISVTEFSDIAFRQEMVDACDASNVQTFRMFDHDGRFSVAGEQYLSALYSSFYNAIETLTNEISDKNAELQNRIFNVDEIKKEFIKQLDKWINNFRTELIKLHDLSPTHCIFHTIKSEAYQKELSKPKEILSFIGTPAPGPSPGLVVENSAGDMCIMSVGMIQCWGNVIGNGGYSFEPGVGVVTIQEAEMMDKKQKHPLALSYEKTTKMLTADALKTTPFSGTIHDYYHLLNKCRYSPEFQGMLEYMKCQLRKEFGLNDNEYSEDIWRFIDKNYSLGLLQDCVEQDDFLGMLNQSNYLFATRLFIILDGLKNSAKWQEYKINSNRFVEEYIKSQIEKLSQSDNPEKLMQKDELKFPEIMIEYFYQAYVNKNPLAIDIVNNNDPYPLKFLKIFLLFMDAKEENVKQFEELYKKLEPQVKWGPKKKSALINSSGLPFFELRIGDLNLEFLCQWHVTSDNSLKAERINNFKKELERLVKVDKTSVLSHNASQLAESKSAMFKSSDPGKQEANDKEEFKRRKESNDSSIGWFSNLINYFRK